LIAAKKKGTGASPVPKKKSKHGGGEGRGCSSALSNVGKENIRERASFSEAEEKSIKPRQR